MRVEARTRLEELCKNLRLLVVGPQTLPWRIAMEHCAMTREINIHTPGHLQDHIYELQAQSYLTVAACLRRLLLLVFLDICHLFSAGHKGGRMVW